MVFRSFSSCGLQGWSLCAYCECSTGLVTREFERAGIFLRLSFSLFESLLSNFVIVCWRRSLKPERAWPAVNNKKESKTLHLTKWSVLVTCCFNLVAGKCVYPKP